MRKISLKFLPGLLKNLALLGTVSLLSAEAAVRLTGLDHMMLKPLLYYQTSDQAVQEASPNPRRLYQLKPGAHGTTVEFNKPVSINSLGFRGPEATARKAPGTTRIVCLGGSTTYGAAVADKETFPFYLQEELNKRYKGRFEVWNAGLCAYVLGSEAAYAREIIEKYDPDVLIFQHANQGRRAFAPDTPYAHYFRQNPELYRENLRYVPFPGWSLSWWLLRHCAAYRAGVVLANCFLFVEQNNPAYDGEFNNLAEFEAFYRQAHAQRRIFLMMHKDLRDYPSPELSAMLAATGVPNLDIFSPRNISEHPSSEYLMIHPPAYVYKWYGQAMARELERYGAVKRK